VRLAITFVVASAGLVLACATPGPHPHAGIRGLWREYQGLPSYRALALAGDPDRVWVAGAAGGRLSQAEARTAALEECAAHRQERRMQAPCRIYAIGDRIVW
jgi:hypothetical protein